MKINVKEMKTQKTYQVECENGQTGNDLILKISEVSGHAPNEMKLIMGAQIIKKDKTLEQNRCFDGCTVTMTLSAKAQAIQSQSTSIPQIKVDSAVTKSNESMPASTLPQFGFGGQNPVDLFQIQKQMLEQMNQSPEMKQMMSEVFSDPERVKQLIYNHPGIKKMMEKNPRFADALNDPATIQQLVNTFSDPAKMDEQMRQMETQLTNIQNMPDGQLILNKIEEQMKDLYDGQQEPNQKGWFMPGEGGAGQNGANESQDNVGMSFGDTILQQLLASELLGGIAQDEPLPISYVQSLIPQSIQYDPFGSLGRAQGQSGNSMDSPADAEAQVDMMLEQFENMGLTYDQIESAWDNPYVQQVMETFNMSHSDLQNVKQLLLKKIAERKANKASRTNQSKLVQNPQQRRQDNAAVIANLRQKWQNQYQQIKDMGLDMAEEEILQLLEIYNGNVEAVISHIYDNN